MTAAFAYALAGIAVVFAGFLLWLLRPWKRGERP